MSSPNELDDMEADFEELMESDDDTPPEAFYLALKRALSQLDAEPSTGNWL
jgi:hypothetical protein